MPVDVYAPLFLGISAITSLFIAHKYINKNQLSLPLPPSPPSDPIIGHARYIPLEYSWKTFSAWRKKFGDIIYVHVLGRPIIILNSLQITRDLFDKSSANFSDRPYMLVINDLVGLGSTLPFLPYGDRWRHQRRLLQRHLDPQSVQSIRPIQQEQVESLLQALVQSPQQFSTLIRQLTSVVSLKTVYGNSIISADGELLGKFKKAARMITEVGDAGGTIIDIMPTLRHVPTWFPSWFPGVAVKRHALQTRALLKEIADTPVEELRAKRANGVSETCVMSKVLDEYEKSEIQTVDMEEDNKALGAIIFSAGYDTTNSALLTFFLMMTLNPEVVKRAQVILDELTNGERTITLEDRPKLLYIDCVVKEVYRINPPGPVGLPHQSVRAEQYDGWTIPAGSMVIANLWELVNDEENFSNPRTFSPERYLRHNNNDSSQDKIKVDREDPTDIVFGFGRRICPGRFFADATVWLVVANVLAFFDIGPIVDPKTGKEIPPECAYHAGFTSNPKEFKCNIMPRSARHTQLIRELHNDTVPTS